MLATMRNKTIDRTERERHFMRKADRQILASAVVVVVSLLAAAWLLWDVLH